MLKNSLKKMSNWDYRHGFESMDQSNCEFQKHLFFSPKHRYAICGIDFAVLSIFKNKKLFLPSSRVEAFYFFKYLNKFLTIMKKH